MSAFSSSFSSAVDPMSLKWPESSVSVIPLVTTTHTQWTSAITHRTRKSSKSGWVRPISCSQDTICCCMITFKWLQHTPARYRHPSAAFSGLIWAAKTHETNHSEGVKCIISKIKCNAGSSPHVPDRFWDEWCHQMCESNLSPAEVIITPMCCSDIPDWSLLTQ